MPRIPTARADGRKIRALIREHGWTVTGFARKVGCARQTLWNICGPRPPDTSVVLLRAIARELGVEPAEIGEIIRDAEDGAGQEDPAA